MPVNPYQYFFDALATVSDPLAYSAAVAITGNALFTSIVSCTRLFIGLLEKNIAIILLLLGRSFRERSK